MDSISASPLSVISLSRVHDPAWASAGHEHEHFEFIYLKRGIATFETSEESVDISPHTIAIIKPGQLHKFTVSSPKCEFTVLNFTLDPSASIHPDIAELTGIVGELAQRPHIILNPGPKNAVQNALKRMLWARQNQEKWDGFLSQLLLMEILVYVSREILSVSGFSGDSGINDAIMRARDYIERNCDKPITLNEIANHVFLSESYLSHSFKARFGISPKTFILQTRVTRAKQLLATTDMKINDIALKVGFLSQQRFNDAFRHLENLTPLKYRQNSKNLTADQSAEL